MFVTYVRTKWLLHVHSRSQTPLMVPTGGTTMEEGLGTTMRHVVLDLYCSPLYNTRELEPVLINVPSGRALHAMIKNLLFSSVERPQVTVSAQAYLFYDRSARP